jgi:hypothetical protein
MRLHILLIFAFLNSFLLIAQEKSWTKAFTKEGIDIYTRPVQGSSFDEFKGITVLNARIEVIAEVLRDIPSYTQWVSDISEASVISRIDRDNLTIYLRQVSPWPVSDRDMVLDVTTQKNFNKGYSYIRFVAKKSSNVPLKSGVVRITDMEGSYLLEYVDREHTKLTYIVRSNPGGAIPASIANMAAKDLPFETLADLSLICKSNCYIHLADKSADKLIIEDLVSKGILKK